MSPVTLLLGHAGCYLLGDSICSTTSTLQQNSMVVYYHVGDMLIDDIQKYIFHIGVIGVSNS
jgi:hypothetical protein